MALNITEYLRTAARIDQEKVIITSHAVDRYYEHIHLDGKRQDWERLPSHRLTEIRASLKWRKCQEKVRQLLVESDWRSPAHWEDRVQATKTHGREVYLFKRYRCLFWVVEDKYNPQTFVLLTVRFLNRAE